jgi:predicted nucleotidyltransferase
MTKKYVPSGYQIINLGSVADGDIIAKGTNSDVDLLIELAKEQKLTKKPILLSFIATNHDISVVPLIWGKVLYYSFVKVDNNGAAEYWFDLSITIKTDEEQITVGLHDAM